jgi:hypothetical protein
MSEDSVVVSFVNCCRPALVFETRECEAWFLAARLAGARRFKSFHELMDWMRTVDLRELTRCGGFAGVMVSKGSRARRINMLPIDIVMVR